MAVIVAPSSAIQDKGTISIEGRHKPRLYPALYQIHTRVLMTALSRALRHPATLDDVADKDLDWLAENGFDWVWFLGVWQTGAAGRKVSLENPEWRREYRELLPDFSEGDVCGSSFAIKS